MLIIRTKVTYTNYNFCGVASEFIENNLLATVVNSQIEVIYMQKGDITLVQQYIVKIYRHIYCIEQIWILEQSDKLQRLLFNEHLYSKSKCFKSCID